MYICIYVFSLFRSSTYKVLCSCSQQQSHCFCFRSSFYSNWLGEDRILGDISIVTILRFPLVDFSDIVPIIGFALPVAVIQRSSQPRNSTVLVTVWQKIGHKEKTHLRNHLREVVLSSLGKLLFEATVLGLS